MHRSGIDFVLRLECSNVWRIDCYLAVVQYIARYKWQDVYVCKVCRHSLVSQLHSINNAWQSAVRLDYVRTGNVKLINVIVLNQSSLKQSPTINRHVKVIATCLDELIDWCCHSHYACFTTDWTEQYLILSWAKD